jgi:hypothetical protein
MTLLLFVPGTIFFLLRLWALRYWAHTSALTHLCVITVGSVFAGLAAFSATDSPLNCLMLLAVSVLCGWFAIEIGQWLLQTLRLSVTHASSALSKWIAKRLWIIVPSGIFLYFLFFGSPEVANKMLALGITIAAFWLIVVKGANPFRSKKDKKKDSR